MRRLRNQMFRASGAIVLALSVLGVTPLGAAALTTPYGEFNPTHVCVTGHGGVNLQSIDLPFQAADRWVLQRVWVYSTANGGTWGASNFFAAVFNGYGIDPQTFYYWTGTAWLDAGSVVSIALQPTSYKAMYVEAYFLDNGTWVGAYGAWSQNAANGTYWCTYSGTASKPSSDRHFKLPSSPKLTRSLSAPSSITGAPFSP